MKRKEFESRVLSLWITTRVPLTRANLQYATGESRKQVESWLDGMVADGTLDLDHDDDGELVWAVRGAARPAKGTTSIADVVNMKELERDVRGAGKALALVGRVAAPVAKTGDDDGRKSLVVSGALSFFLGPLGLLYSAPLRVAMPAIGLFALLYFLLPSFLFTPLLGLLLPLSALTGIAYAWRHNQTDG